MINSLTTINSLLVETKKLTASLQHKLQQAGFDTSLTIGLENEYTIQSLISTIESLTLQFLTITASRSQFIQRTSYVERKQIESYLQKLLVCIRQTNNTLELLKQQPYEIKKNLSLCFTTEEDGLSQLALANAIEYIDLLKPFTRMLELVIAQERIHALSAVLEALLQKDHTIPEYHGQDSDHELTEEQSNALELSHYLIKQAL